MVALLERPPRRELADFLESVRQGAAGPALDYRLTALPWGFLPEEVDTPVTWWHGIDDDVVPLHQAQDVVSRLPDARLREVPGASQLGSPSRLLRSSRARSRPIGGALRESCRRAHAGVLLAPPTLLESHATPGTSGCRSFRALGEWLVLWTRRAEGTSRRT